MSTFTGSELEFLAGLDKSWWTLYWSELARLLKGKDTASDSQPPPQVDVDVDVDAARSKRAIRKSTAKILAFAPEFRACGEACPFRRRHDGTDAGAGDALQRRVELAAGNR